MQGQLITPGVALAARRYSMPEHGTFITLGGDFADAHRQHDEGFRTSCAWVVGRDADAKC
jgi:hypothetical protein